MEPPPGARAGNPDASRPPGCDTGSHRHGPSGTGAAPRHPRRADWPSPRHPHGGPTATLARHRRASGRPTARLSRRTGRRCPAPPRRAPKQTFAPCRSTPPPPVGSDDASPGAASRGGTAPHNAVRPRSGPRTGGVGGGKARRGRPSVLAGQGRAGGGDEEGPLARKSDGRQGSWVRAGTNPGKGKSRDTTGPPGKPPRDPTTPTRGGGPATPRTPAGLSQPSAVPPTPRPRSPPGLARSRLNTPIPEGSPFHSLTRPSASRLSVHHRHPASSGSPPGLAARGNAAERGGPTRGPRTATGGCVSGPEQVGWLLAARRLVGGAQVGVDRLPPPPHGTRRGGQARAHARARSHGPAPDAGPGPAEPSPDSEGGGAGHSRPRTALGPTAGPAQPTRQSDGALPTRRGSRSPWRVTARSGWRSGGWGVRCPQGSPLRSLEKAFSPRAHRPPPSVPRSGLRKPADVYASARLGRRGLR